MSLADFAKSSHTINHSAKPEMIDIPAQPSVFEHNNPLIELSRDDYLSQSECTERLSALTDLPYTDERGRSIMKFGENYRPYNGSRNKDSIEFPSCVSELMNSYKLNREFGKKNSTL